MLLLFANFESSLMRFAQLIVNCLAVAGGFLVGWFLMTILLWCLNRWLLWKKTPEGLIKIGQYLGGLILAILVAIVVFGHGEGWTLFGGGLEGNANGTGKTENATETKEVTEPVTTSIPKKARVTPPSEEQLHITMLGGRDVKEQRFYLYEDDPTPKTFSELKSILQKKKESTTKKMAVEIRFASQNTLPQSHPAVLMLASWASETAGMTVTFPAEGP